MKKTIKKSLSIFIIFLILFSLSSNVFASINENTFKMIEYSKEYKEWLNLPEEERDKVIMPQMYDFKSYDGENNNILNITQNLKNTYMSSYDLREEIPLNTKIKNQGKTGNCWAFASLAVLESNLAMKDKKNNKQEVEYDYSERHLTYATSREAFLNNAINEKGFSREANGGGNFFLATSYLSNGLGAVAESSMPYSEDKNNIDISELNKTVVTTVDDIYMFETTPGYQSDINKIKDIIVNYGGVEANICGNDILKAKNYRNDTGAIYSNDIEKYPADHAVTIIGWDDNYSRNNFNEDMKPGNNGAWIIKNSWGEKLEIGDLNQIKKDIYIANESYFNQYGITRWEDVPNEVCITILETSFGQGRVVIENGKLYCVLGENGYMYLSYEDVNLTIIGYVKKAENTKNYANIYQHEYQGGNRVMTFAKEKILLINVFDTKSSNEELTKVGFSTPMDIQKCRVLVNPNGNNFNELQRVELQEGGYETLKEGYNTIELAHPIKLTGSKFLVAVEIENPIPNTEGGVAFPVLVQKEPYWNNINPVSGKCFIAYENINNNTMEVVDAATLKSVSGGALENCIIPLKAITTDSVNSSVLSSIRIKTPPTKVAYEAGDDFDKDGMVVEAVYSNGTSKEVTNYKIVNGGDLKEGQANVTIRYTEDSITKEVTQNITVTAKKPEEKVTLSSIKITKAPSKVVYTEGEKFDLSGMKVEAVYSNGKTKEITGYKVTNGDKLTKGQTSVKITYTEDGVTKEVTQTITVNAKQDVKSDLSSIKITKTPSKVTYIEGEKFDIAGMEVKAVYSDKTEKVITNYKVTNGDKLTKGQTSVTISYTEKNITKTVNQAITVKAKEEKTTLTSISVKTPPTKVKYKEEEKFNDSGMVIEATYSDGTTKEITNYSVIDGEKLVVGQSTVTITYTEDGITKTTTQNITVNAKQKELPTISNFDNAKGVISSATSYTYVDMPDKKDHTIMKIDLSNVKKDGKGERKFYFYLSNKNGETNINSNYWKEFKFNGESTTITIDTADLSYADKLNSGSNLFLYIKEIATLNDESIGNISTIELTNDANLELYVNDVKKDGANKDNRKKDEDKSKDGTIAKGNIPNAGLNATVWIIITITLGVGVVSGVLFYRNRMYKK